MSSPDSSRANHPLPALKPVPVDPSVVLDRVAAQPHTVNIAGTFPSPATSSGSPSPADPSASNIQQWDPAEPGYLMAYHPTDGYWWLTVDLPAGQYDYKVTIDESWEENYGVRGMRNGPNLSLELRIAQKVTFCFDYDTKIIETTELDNPTTPPLAPIDQ
ncbi:pullulanase X25 domain-containing protein [Arthrobacter sp. Soc17.1.1.1]|uniref:pullulanase X25 domain-containing protein n=1 Tax=Arthrobacter sp. Soc17.1.1.1 TaxID=3121277 RepID=UPI003FA5EC9B